MSAANLTYTLGLDSGGFTNGIKGAIAQLGNIGLAVEGLKKIASGLTLGVRLAADMESTSTAINTVLKDMTLTKAVLEQLNTFAATTPFELPGIAATARQLLGAGTQVSDLQGELQVLGDLAAGAGTDMGRLATVLNQVRGAGKLMTQDFLQLSDAGVAGLRQELAKIKGIQVSEVGDAMSKGQISAEDLWKTLRAMTGEGGKFFNAMVSQSKTWNGLMSTLSDNAGALLRTLSQPVMESLKPSLESAIAGLDKAVNFARVFVETLKMAAADDRLGEFLGLSVSYGLKKGWAAFLETVFGALPAIQDGLYDAVYSAMATAWNATAGKITGIMFDAGGGFVQSFMQGINDGVEEAEAKLNEWMKAGQLKVEADKSAAKKALEEAGRAGGQAFAEEAKKGMDPSAAGAGGGGVSGPDTGSRIKGYSRMRQGGADEARARAAGRMAESEAKRGRAYQKAFPGLEGSDEFYGRERPGGGSYGDGGDPWSSKGPQRLRDSFNFPGLDSAFGPKAKAAMAGGKAGDKDTTQTSLLEEIRDGVRRIVTE
jgi:tape measure domain-containing protein